MKTLSVIEIMSEQNKEGEKKEVKGYINEDIISNRDNVGTK